VLWCLEALPSLDTQFSLPWPQTMVSWPRLWSRLMCLGEGEEVDRLVERVNPESYIHNYSFSSLMIRYNARSPLEVASVKTHMNCNITIHCKLRSTMLQDCWKFCRWFLLKDILLALTKHLHGCIIFNQLKTVCVLYDVYIYIKLLSPEAVFHSKIQPKRWRLGLRPDPAGRLIDALSPVFMVT